MRGHRWCVGMRAWEFYCEEMLLYISLRSRFQQRVDAFHVNREDIFVIEPQPQGAKALAAR